MTDAGVSALGAGCSQLQSCGLGIDVIVVIAGLAPSRLGISVKKLYLRIDSRPMTRSIGEEFKIVAFISIEAYLFKFSEKYDTRSAI